MAVAVKTVLVSFWGRCITLFRTYFSGDWDVHWGYGILTHGHMLPMFSRESTRDHSICSF